MKNRTVINNSVVAAIVMGMVIAMLLGLTGCLREEVPYRTYVETTLQATDPEGLAALEESPMGSILMDVAYTDGINWTVPPEWTEQVASGIRFASFRSRVSDVEMVIVGFPGEVGTLEANVLRWLKQMNVEVPRPLLTYYLNNIVPRTNVAGVAYIDVDLTEFAQYGRDTAIIATIIRFRDQSVFLKMQDERRKLEQERPNFNAFIASLQLNDTQQGS